MQYPPQQQPSMDQPQYPPSEIYQYEQPQPYMPEPEISQPPLFAQEIAIYPHRKQVVWRTTLTAMALGFLVLITILLSFLMGFLAGGPLKEDHSLAPLLIFLVCVLIVLLAEIALVGRLTWSWVSIFLLNRKPVLMIHREGIMVSRMPAVSGVFISWGEIEAIYIASFIYKYLCIRPKDTNEFLSRFNFLERLIRRSNALVGIPPLMVPQVFLEKPVEEILQQLHQTYASELSYYRILLQPS